MTGKTYFSDRLVHGAERILTYRKKRKLKIQMRQQAKHPVRDWAEAIVWAACVVLVVNQFLFQAYRIPSESMVKTLLIGDMIFVDKFSFGPELLPGVAKTQGPKKPRRGNVIIFENPSYLSKGPLYTIAQQMLYMLSLTLVDIDRDENGEQRVHYLIKRAIGVEGDRVKLNRGEVSLMPAGTGSWMREDQLTPQSVPVNHAIRSFPGSDYEKIEAAGMEMAYKEAGIEAPARIAGMVSDRTAYQDPLALEQSRISTIAGMYPHDARFAQAARRNRLGWYIPEGRIFPMGDNRDNSRDARYFGPVSIKKVLGQALFIYFPFGRVGAIR